MSLLSQQDLWVMGGLFVLLLILFLGMLFKITAHNVRGKKSDAVIPNFTETVILFQTLRGIIHEQKNLAREFNASFDKKVAIVQQFLKKSADEQTALRNELQHLKKQIAEAREELASLRNILRIETDRDRNVLEGALRQFPVPPSDPVSDFIVDVPARPREAVQPAPLFGDQAEDTLQIIAKPDESDGVIDAWNGFDFAGIEETDAFEVPETPPDEPSDPELAREAFRTLLDIQPEMPRTKPDLAIPVEDFLLQEHGGTSPEEGNAFRSDRDKGAPLRARVYSYYDAGMTVSEIARELGIGKGEVRLMLNLRDRDERQRQRI